MCHPGRQCLESQLCDDKMCHKWRHHQDDGDANKDVGDVDAEDVGDVYDYVLMSLPLFRVISVTRTILGRNHFHWVGADAQRDTKAVLQWVAFL